MFWFLKKKEREQPQVKYDPTSDLREWTFKFNEQRHLWHAYMDKFIKKYGMPSLYAGFLNYNYDYDFDIDKFLIYTDALDEKKRIAAINKKLEQLRTWSYPGSYAIALYPNVAKIVILGEAFNMQRIVSFKKEKIGRNTIYTIKINRAGEREIKVPIEKNRSIREVESLLNACINIGQFNTQLTGMEELYPYQDDDIDKSILQFEWISLALPMKEFLYALNQADDKIPNLEIESYNPGYFRFKSTISGLPINWTLGTGDKNIVFDHIMGDSEPLIGYDNVRLNYDKVVRYLSKRYGSPTEVQDVPDTIKPISIMKALREDKVHIETIFESDKKYISVEIIAFKEDKKEAHISIYANDIKLMSINSGKLKVNKTNSRL